MEDRVLYLILGLIILGLFISCIKKYKYKLVISFLLTVLVMVTVYIVNYTLIYPSDTVTITALNDKSEFAEGNEIVFKGIKKGKLDLSHKVISGIWLDMYGVQRWRTYGQKNLTNEIKIKVKKGTSRYLVFNSDKWAGKCEVKLNNNSGKVIDCYSNNESGDNLEIALEDTNISFYNILFVSIEFIISMILYLLLFLKKDLILSFIKKNKMTIVYLVIAFIGFLLLMVYGDKRSIWVDDTGTMGYANKDLPLSRVFYYMWHEDPTTAPLFPLVYHFWSKLIPIGPKMLSLWLRIPSIVCNAIGFYLLAVTVRRGWGKYIGLIAEIMVITSSTLYTTSAYAIRPYGFIVTASIFVIYSLVIKLEDGFRAKKESIVLNSLAMLVVMSSHYFGILMCFGVFLYETVRFFRKKSSWHYIISYFITGIIFLPWLILILINARRIYGGTFWPEVPSLLSIRNLLTWLFSNQSILYFAFILGVLVLVYKALLKLDKNKKEDIKFELNTCLCYIIILVVFISYVYSKYIKPEASVWVHRYFLELLPLVIILSSYGLIELLDIIFINLQTNRRLIYCLAGVFIFIWVGIDSIVNVKHEVETIYQPYREVADALLYKGDIYDKDTLVVATFYYANGWDYYLTHNGKYDLIKNVNTLEGIDIKDIKKIYLFEVHKPMTEYDKEVLDKNFNLVGKDQSLGLSEYIRK
jgi:membrane protein